MSFSGPHRVQKEELAIELQRQNPNTHGLHYCAFTPIIKYTASLFVAIQQPGYPFVFMYPLFSLMASCMGYKMLHWLNLLCLALGSHIGIFIDKLLSLGHC